MGMSGRSRDRGVCAQGVMSIQPSQVGPLCSAVAPQVSAELMWLLACPVPASAGMDEGFFVEERRSNPG